MIKKLILFILILLSLKSFPQQQIKKVQFITTDVTNFWTAYDSLQTTIDTFKRINILQNLYFDKATIGLKYYIYAKSLTPEYMEEVIRTYPKFWNSVREQTIQVNSFEDCFENIQKKLIKLYPHTHGCNVYFLIGGLKSGGLINGNNILIGTELATSNNCTNATELKKAMQERMQLNKNVLFILAHEYLHIQQNQSLSDSTINVLTLSLKEGSADFIASLITNENVPGAYMKYGSNNEKEIWMVFKKEMYTNEVMNWTFGGVHPSFNSKDLGYYVGYAICKSYYDNAVDKQKGVKDIIELDYSNQQQINKFLINSKYPEKFN